MFLTLIIIIILILSYFHISAQYKKPPDALEIYEATYESNKQIEILNINKQPYLFNIREQTPLLFITTLDELMADEVQFNITLFNMPQYYKLKTNYDPLETTLKGGISITSQYANHCCFGYNYDITEGIWKTIKDELDDILSPSPVVVNSNLGIICGSIDAHTPPEYHTHTAKYLVVQQGEINVKLTTLRHCHRLAGCEGIHKNVTHSSSNFTLFSSFVNIWEDNNKIANTPFLEFTLYAGMVLSIPAFCYWSIQFNSSDVIVFNVDYMSLINYLANTHNKIMFRLKSPDYVVGGVDIDDEPLPPIDPPIVHIVPIDVIVPPIDVIDSPMVPPIDNDDISSVVSLQPQSQIIKPMVNVDDIFGLLKKIDDVNDTTPEINDIIENLSKNVEIVVDDATVDVTVDATVDVIDE